MKDIKIPKNYNYIAVFLTLGCNLKCPYCINLNEFGSNRAKVFRKPMEAKEWIEAINRLRIDSSQNLPVTLQGGEPTIHPDFFEIVNGIKDDIKLDLLTNMMFDVDEFIKNVPVEKFTRDAKYAAIRVSYHPGQNDIDDLIYKHHKMRDAGFYVGIYSVMTPQNIEHIKEVEKRCIKEGIDFRTKEYLGFDGKKWHGKYQSLDAISQQFYKFCECKTTELLIAPSGHIFRCHSDLYENRVPIGHILYEDFKIEDIFRPCFVYGHCNPCDVKIKTNRFQEYGHSSVEIKNIRELDDDELKRLKNGDNGGGIENFNYKKAH